MTCNNEKYILRYEGLFSKTLLNIVSSFNRTIEVV